MYKFLFNSELLKIILFSFSGYSSPNTLTDKSTKIKKVTYMKDEEIKFMYSQNVTYSLILYNVIVNLHG